MDWYKKEKQKLLREFGVSEQHGLSETEAQVRLTHYGENKIHIERAPHLFTLFLQQLKNIFLIILLIAGSIKLLIAEFTDATLIFVITFISALIGSLQELKAQKMTQKIKQLLPKTSIVLRDGKQKAIPSHTIVPGDILVLVDGSYIAADGVILSDYGLLVNESLFTGESLPVKKSSKDNSYTLENLPILERTNIVHSGTIVAAGTAHILVTETAMNTGIGKMIHIIKQTRKRSSPLQKDLELLSKKLLLVLLIALVLVFLIGYVQGHQIKDLVFTLISLLVSVVPEGLPLAFAIMLARAAYQLAINEKVLIKNPLAAETIGSISVLIMDKTGTLTQNQPNVVSCLTPDVQLQWDTTCYRIVDSQKCISKEIAHQQKHPLWLIGLTGALLNESEEIEENGNMQQKGEPLLIAFGKFAEKLGFYKEQIHQAYPKIDELPFSSATRLRYTSYRLENEKILSIVSGAPEEVLAAIEEKTNLKKYTDGLSQLLAKGQRTIALGYAITTTPIASYASIKFTFLGLLGIEDLVRPEAASVVTQLQEINVEICIATGDHPATTCSIAEQIGKTCIQDELKNSASLSLKTRIQENHIIFSRITPQDKLLLVKEYHKTKHASVGMIGDGVNDVPALNAADVGISFGSSGTDAAREAADILLMNDSIEALIPCILAGRNIRNAVLRVVHFVLTTATSEICIILFSLTLGLPNPLLANQILWLHIVTDGFLDISLIMEPIDTEQEKKRLKKRSIFNYIIFKKIIIVGVAIAFFSLLTFYWALDTSLPYAHTMVFTTLTLFQWAVTWLFRSLNKKPYTLGYTTNRWLLIMTVAVFCSHLMALYFQPLRKLLHFTPLTITDWLICLIFPSIFFILSQRKNWFLINDLKEETL